jgi:hypothetical protein
MEPVESSNGQNVKSWMDISSLTGLFGNTANVAEAAKPRKVFLFF